MVTPYPDLRHFTVRDYGNRVALYRLLEAFAGEDVKATFAVNGEIAKRYPPLMEALTGHQIITHGLSTNHIHHEALSESEETDFDKNGVRQPPRQNAWLDVACTQSIFTNIGSTG